MISVVLGGAVLEKARIIDPMAEKEEARRQSKEKELEWYQVHRDRLISQEVHRLQSQKRDTVVLEYDCGAGAKQVKRERMRNIAGGES